MTGLDIIVLLVMGGLGVAGFRKGFTTEAISLAAWAAGIFAVWAFHAPVAAALTDTVGTESGASALAAALLFGIVFGIGKFAASKIGATTRGSALGVFDRVLGLGFGAFKGLLAASLVFLVVSLGYDTIFGGGAERPAWMKDARTYPLLDATARAIVDYTGDRRRGGVADGSTTDASR
jgi:membrane protein required for colicin V production